MGSRGHDDDNVDDFYFYCDHDQYRKSLMMMLMLLQYANADPQCAAGDDEPMVALVVGGRHPGHYFLDSDDFNDVITRLHLTAMECNSPQDGCVSSHHPAC